MFRNIDGMQQWQLEMELSHLIGWLIATRHSAEEAEESVRQHRTAEKETLAQISKVRQQLGLPDSEIDQSSNSFDLEGD
ncbi:hypothetical protein K7H09_23505 [Halomonas sp. IOP_14]|uniref:hypothetical protein n=1 Tax=Halomonas sp. IOP_14 TaxID=2873295 RepID=UPI001E460EAE|nr:hypothetical protein [Halomonas sp. IOP_14]MCD1588973.1 hypothetical protein [Halomonas sp. IOP_14]